MTDRPVAASEQVSRQMRKMPRSDTKPEIALRRQLHSRGMRYRLHPKNLPGRPDVALTRAKIAVFVDRLLLAPLPGSFHHAEEQRQVVGRKAASER